MFDASLHPVTAYLHTLDAEARSRCYLAFADSALKHYDLQGAHTIFLQHNAGIAYYVEAEPAAKRFLLKIYAPVGFGTYLPDAAEIESRLTWLAIMSQHPELIVQAPLPNRSGTLVTTASDPLLSTPFLCSLQRWVGGDLPNGDLTAQQLHSIGIMLAKWHTAGSQCPQALLDPLAQFDATGISEWVQNLHAAVALGLLTAAQYATIVATGTQLQKALAQLVPTSNSWGPIHGDLHHDNLIFYQDTVCPIDFDNLQVAPYLLDLGMILYHIHYQGADAQRALLSGYYDIRHSSRVAEQELDMALIYAALGNLAFQITIPEQWPTFALARNLRQLADEFCRPFLEGEPIVAS